MLVSCRIIYEMVFNLFNMLLRCLSFLFWVASVVYMWIFLYFITCTNKSKSNWLDETRVWSSYSLINSLESRTPFSVFSAHCKFIYLTHTYTGEAYSTWAAEANDIDKKKHWAAVLQSSVFILNRFVFRTHELCSRFVRLIGI